MLQEFIKFIKFSLVLLIYVFSKKRLVSIIWSISQFALVILGGIFTVYVCFLGMNNVFYSYIVPGTITVFIFWIVFSAIFICNIIYYSGKIYVPEKYW